MALFRCGSVVCGSVFEVVVQLCSGVVQLCVCCMVQMWFSCGFALVQLWLICVWHGSYVVKL